MDPFIHNRRRKGSRQGFTLIELMLGVIIIGILASSLVMPMISFLRRQQLAKEQKEMAAIAAAIERTFWDADANRNIANIAGYPATTTSGAPTSFGGASGIGKGAVLVPAPHWARKLGLAQGYSMVGLSASKQYNGMFHQIAVNPFGTPRVLLAGPIDEPHAQRYLLLSIAAPANRGLALPEVPSDPIEYAAYFDSIWHHLWDGEQAPPALWSSLLTPDQLQAWIRGSSGTTNTDRLIVEKIVQKKYRVVLNNSIANIESQVRVEGISAPFLTCSGVGSSTSAFNILHGRWLVAEARPIGSVDWSQVSHQQANSPLTITVQTQ